MFVDTGRHHQGYIKWGQYTTKPNIMSRLCRTCGYAFGDHGGDKCPDEFGHTPVVSPERILRVHKNTEVI